MDEKEKKIGMENAYLETVLAFLKRKIWDMRDSMDTKKRLLQRSRQDEGILETNGSSGRAADMTQHLLEDSRQLSSIELLARNLQNYERMLSSPYFGRFDFKEDGYSSADKIYIGLHNVYDEDGDGDILVYDWRAPICSIFYQFEPGKAFYPAPDGKVNGEVTLKRQYRIENSILRYYFDCSLVINDEILGEVLARNASPTMHNIIRTIQSEQDRIIRNTESDLLIAQGAAGSGKTTIALHRIAYLLYHSSLSGLSSKNIVILSPNDIFSRYIGSILPELGEENVPELTFEVIFAKIFDLPLRQSRAQFAETLLQNGADGGISRDAYTFKGSAVFAEILRRFVLEYERSLIPFADVSYGGTLIAKGETLRVDFLDNKVGAPALSRLRRMESTLLSKIHPLQRKRHLELQEQFKTMEGHQYDFKTVARYTAIQETEQFLQKVRAFTRFDVMAVYKALFADRKRFELVCEGLPLPQNIGEIIEHTAHALKNGFGYEEAAPLAYLSLLIDRLRPFDDIRHVVIDEAQDYLPLHYAVFGILFAGASFTVLGDIGQSVETGATMALYDDAAAFLRKKKPVILNLQKSYRSSYEIMSLAQKIPAESHITAFERHEKAPELIRCAKNELPERLIHDVEAALSEGFDTAAILCKTEKDAAELYELLRPKTRVTLLEENGEVGRGAVIVPAYLSKGLEFDCVFVPDLSDENYGDSLGRQLLYIACTRALHRLNLYYTEDCDIVKRLQD